MNNKSLAVTLGIIVLVLLAGLGAYVALQGGTGTPPEVVPGMTPGVFAPAAGAEWQVSKEYAIQWRPAGNGTVSIAVINPSFGGGYRFNICGPVPPYPCELPDSGQSIWAVPPDDGHNEWGASADYRIV